MASCGDGASQVNNSPCDSAGGGGALSPPDEEVLFAYYDMVGDAFSEGEHALALEIMKVAHARYPCCAVFPDGFAGVAYKVYDRCCSSNDVFDQEAPGYRIYGQEAAYKTIPDSPEDLKYYRFNENLLALSIIDEALSIPEHLMVFDQQLCKTHKREEVIQEMKKLREALEVTQRYGIDIHRRSNQVNRKESVPETELKRLDSSCWDRISTEKKVEFLAMKYEDLRAFFVDWNDEEALRILLGVLSRAVVQAIRIWHCETCKMDFIDWESHRQHVWSQHIRSLPLNLQTMVPEDPSRTNLPVGSAKGLLLSFDSAELVLHLCHSTPAEASSEPGFLECTVPDYKTLLFWLCMDEYDHKLVEKKPRQEDDILKLLESKYYDLKGVEQEKERLAVAKGSPSNAIAIATQLDVTSQLLQHEQALGEETLQLYQKLVESGTPPVLACEFLYHKIRENIADYECELTHACCIDHGTHLLPHLKPFLKLRFMDLMYAYSTELEKNGTHKNPIEGSNLSKQIDNSCAGKNELIPSDPGDGDILNTIVHKNGINSPRYSQSKSDLADTACIQVTEIGSELESGSEPVSQNQSELPESVRNLSIPQTMLNTKDEMHQRRLSTAVILALWHLELFRDELSMKKALHSHVGSPCVVCELCRVFIALGKKSEECFVNATLEDFNLVKLVSAFHCPQKECYSAPDVLAAILDCLHASFTSSGDPPTNLIRNHSKLCLCQSETCIARKLFGMEISEVVLNRYCNFKVTNEKFKVLYSVSPEELCSTKIACAGNSFEELLKHVAFNHQYVQAQETHQFVCQRNSNCSQHDKLYQTLSILPRTFAVVLQWQTNSSIDDISKTLAIISDELDLSALYDGVEKGSKYLLQSMICYSVDYVCFINDFKNRRRVFWTMENVEEISCWDAVVSRCKLESFRPEVLLYIFKES